MNRLYELRMSHCRLKPKRHHFSYQLFMLYLNLEELDDAAKKTWGLSHNHWNLFSVNDRDHIDLGIPGGIAPNLLAWLEQRGKSFSEKPEIYLMTFPSVLGYGFNPISFYYLYSREKKLLCVVAEVVNTFREMKLFLIDHSDENGIWNARLKKNFYVSPFSDPALEFDFKIGPPEKKWRVNIDDYEGGERIFLSSIRGKASSFSSKRLLYYFLKYPFLSFFIIGSIHWHAFLLWKKGLPFFQKSDRKEVQQDLLRPYKTKKYQ